MTMPSMVGIHLSKRVAPLPSSEPLPIFPLAVAAVQQLRAAFSGPPERPSAASAPHPPCGSKAAGLGNHGAGKSWGPGPCMMLSDIDFRKLMILKPF